MAPGVFTREQMEYARQNLRIVSGLYGLLRPFDGVVPYRLEMQARLKTDFCRNLYEFWGNSLARQLAQEGAKVVVDLASAEYSRAVLPHLPPEIRRVRPVFGQLIGGKIVEKGSMLKWPGARLSAFWRRTRSKLPRG